MSHPHKTLNRIIALAVFGYAFILYVLTLAPTASFWDCGEFIAVAHGLQVTHPPGAPFFLLVGRLFTMFMPAEWVAYAMNMMSALCSAVTIMLLYLIIVRLIREWNVAPDEMSFPARFAMYAGAVIGALTFAVTDTFWFNAVEAEVYAMSMFFTAIVVWLPFKWADHMDEPGNERWLVLIAYMFGLALGVHLLNLLAIFFVALIIYFKKTDFTWQSFLIMGAISVAAFLSIYPITVSELPVWSQAFSEASYGLLSPLIFFLLVAIAIAVGIWYTHVNNMHWMNVALVCYAMVMIGYSSYALVFIRSAADPPIDENDPETTSALISYLKREQYGDTPLLRGNSYSNELGQIDRRKEVFFPRRYSGDRRHMSVYAQYSSDLAYFLGYQVNHMYIRYFNWNFVGREADIQDSGWASGFFNDSSHKEHPAHNNYFFLPLLLGLLGLAHHIKRDGKRAFSVGVLFLVTGLAIVVFLNQYPYQPRERDYAYVGSFFAFAIWIGIGATAVLELIAEQVKKSTEYAQYAAAGLMFLAVPGWMLIENYDDHDRSNRYVAPDYAYNLLNSCAPYAILFTNGDNDTFPLWYIQEVEGVRTDVRVVCLSLLNTNWYIKQLKNQWSHESPPLPISYTDEEIDRLDEKFQWRNPNTDFWTPKEVVIPVDKEVIKKRHTLPDGMREPDGPMEGESFELYSPSMDFGMPVDSLDDEIRWYYEGRFLTEIRGEKKYYTYIQDDIILDLLKNNQWVRPIYFAVTVSYDGQLDMQEYFRLEGQAFRVVPKKGQKRSQFGQIEPKIHGERLRSFRFREVDNPNAYFDENIRRMLDQYRTLITQQAVAYQKEGMADSAAFWLKWGEQKVPFETVEGDVTSMVTYAYRYAMAGASEDALRLASEVEEKIMEEFTSDVERIDEVDSQLRNLESEFREARASADMQAARNIQNRSNQLIQARNNVLEAVSYHRSRLVLLQRIYYMLGENERGDGLKDVVMQVAGEWVPFPSDSLENARQAGRLQL